MPELVKSADEQQILDCLKEAIDLIDNHDKTPNEAIEKVARENSFTPGMVELLSRAYNNGRQLGQWKANDSILDKLASYELADSARIITNLYPKADTPAAVAQKTAFDSAYLLPPSWATTDNVSLLKNDLPGLVKMAAEKCPFCRHEMKDCTCVGKKGNYPGCGMGKKKKKKAKDEPVVDPKHLMKVAYGKYQKAKNAYDEARRTTHQHEDHLMSKVAELTVYFRQPDYARLPFEQVEYATRRFYGPAAVDLLSLAYDRAHLKEARALPDDQLLKQRKIPAVYKEACDRSKPPYTIIEDALKTAKDIIEARKREKTAEDAFNRIAGETLYPFELRNKAAATVPRLQPTSNNLLDKKANLTLNPLQLAIEASVIGAGDVMGTSYMHRKEREEKNQPMDYDEALGDERLKVLQAIADQEQMVLGKRHRKKSVDTSIIKDAAGGAIFGSALGAALSRGLGGMPQPKSDLIRDETLALEDPAHINELRKIRANAMLASMLTDPDDPISGYDPDKVLAAYNEIAASAPRVADNVGALKPILRKRLAGHTEPFEAKELVDVEKGLRDVSQPPRTVSESDYDKPF
jgi:hypothetical protein